MNESYISLIISILALIFVSIVSYIVVTKYNCTDNKIIRSIPIQLNEEPLHTDNVIINDNLGMELYIPGQHISNSGDFTLETKITTGYVPPLSLIIERPLETYIDKFGKEHITWSTKQINNLNDYSWQDLIQELIFIDSNLDGGKAIIEYDVSKNLILIKPYITQGETV